MAKTTSITLEKYLPCFRVKKSLQVRLRNWFQSSGGSQNKKGNLDNAWSFLSYLEKQSELGRKGKTFCNTCIKLLPVFIKKKNKLGFWDYEAVRVCLCVPPFSVWITWRNLTKFGTPVLHRTPHGRPPHSVPFDCLRSLKTNNMADVLLLKWKLLGADPYFGMWRSLFEPEIGLH